jgi:hypothetical protein
MTEAELIAEFGLNLERAWGMIQWWTSITFAVLLAAHLGMKYLNIVIVSIIILLYSLLSFLVAQVFFSYMQSAFASIGSLSDLSEQVDLSGLSAHLLGPNSGLLAMTLWVTVLVTFLTTIFYVVFSYRKSRDSSISPQTFVENDAS